MEFIRPERPVILITGASGSIGQAIARELAASDRTLILVGGRHRERLDELHNELLPQCGRVGSYQLDLARREGLEKLSRSVEELYGNVDILINCAGVGQTGLFTEISPTEWEEQIKVNLSAAAWLSRLLLPHMIRQHWGRIINIASIWGETGASMEVAYSTAKAGLIGFTRALAKEVGPSGITVNSVSPGVIDTPMNVAHTPDELKRLADETPLGRIGTGKDVAGVVAFLLSESADFITGADIPVNGGLYI